MSQKELAQHLKQKFKIKYTIKGWNIYVKSQTDISQQIQNTLEQINKKHNLGYKRFFILTKSKGRKKIGSIPFGIAITLN